MTFLRATLAFALTACTVDIIGEQPGAGGSGQATASSGSQSGASSAASGSKVSSGPTSGSSGTGGGTLCNQNGLVDNQEQCEDGNLISGDGCDDQCQFESVCGNGIAEPTEPCDDGTQCSAECLGPCNTDEQIADGETLYLTTAGGQTSQFEPCFNGSPGLVRFIRMQLPPYPAGVFAEAAPEVADFQPMIWIARDCTELLDCGANNDGFAASGETDLLPPGSKVVIGATDIDGNAFSFQLYARTFRLREHFGSDPLGWAYDNWSLDGNGNLTSQGGNGNNARSRPIVIAGLAEIRIYVDYAVDDGPNALLSVSFDGGAYNVEHTIPGDGLRHGETIIVDRPPNADIMELKFEYQGTADAAVHFLEVGPVVPGPG